MTPQIPQGDLLKSSDLESPAMRDLGVKTNFFNSPKLFPISAFTILLLG